MASIAFPQLAKKVTLSDGTTYGYVHVLAGPSKPTFLLIHGAPSSSYVWHHQIESLQKAGFGVVAPDLLGYGDSDRPAEVERYQISAGAAQIAELVRTVVDANTKVIGVGHDLGSPILSHVYVRNKHLFSGLVFIAVGFVIVDAKMDPDFMNTASRQLLGYSTSGYLRVFVAPGTDALVEKHDAAFDSLMYCADPAAWKEHLGAEGGLEKFLDEGKPLPVASWISPAELAMHNLILKGSYTGVFNWYQAAYLVDPPAADRALTAEDKKVTVPTLLVVTGKDYAVIPEAQVQLTQAVAEDLTVERLDVGHWAMLEVKDRVGQLLEDFATTRGL
ncbi:Alpha/Beta hydrolase protein [Lasiosphaeria miniovina]|uniref:Alpha/Beta hydrolase protein n=1 Tax=Lasiosphaeria miniovina TaxID=1954250 RepID=A0AA39ZQN5_9PEZI|nr:Alpha/Beta hydrolase protein [Lasiosphaeria miniovina]KAK0701896.1 Alpha/Beta hydrolase protein [Lasiosphaeria miniovina]